jgi:hypothetical protein
MRPVIADAGPVEPGVRWVPVPQSARGSSTKTGIWRSVFFW